MPSPAEPSFGVARESSTRTIPWLLSTVAHCLLLLALTVQWGHRSWSGPNVHGGVEVTILSPQQGADAGPMEAGGPDEIIAANSNGADSHDRPLPDFDTIGQPPLDGGQPDVLSPVLGEKPAVNISGVLPASAAPPIAGRGAGGGVAAAQGSTSTPRGAHGLPGGYARTGVFGVVAEGRKFVYVFDRSGSMDAHGGAPLHTAKAELIDSLQNLGQTHQFQIIFYNEHPRVFSPTGVPGRLVFGTEQNKYLAQKFVGSITAAGATRHEEALEMALRMAPDVIFFLTDADEPRLTSQQLDRIARINHGTSINAIEFGYGAQGEADNFLVKLARQNGGQHAYVDVARLPRRR